jgi:hypothetical protein
MNPLGQPRRLARGGSGPVGSAGDKGVRDVGDRPQKGSRTLGGNRTTCVMLDKWRLVQCVRVAPPCFMPRPFIVMNSRLVSMRSLEIRTGARVVESPGRRRSINVIMLIAGVWGVTFVACFPSLSHLRLKDSSEVVQIVAMGRSLGPWRLAGAPLREPGIQRVPGRSSRLEHCIGALDVWPITSRFLWGVFPCRCQSIKVSG